jgi:hypothetical protein
LLWPGLFNGRFGTDAEALDVVLDVVASANARGELEMG